MIDSTVQRKARRHFDTATNPPHVTFADGKALRLNLPWRQFCEANWDYACADLIRITIGDWLISLKGHNLEPFFNAIEEGTLLRVRARPELDNDPSCEIDTFITGIRFMKSAGGSSAGVGRQSERHLDEAAF